MKRFFLALCLAGIAGTAAAYQVGDRLGAEQPAPAAEGIRTVSWDDLVPKKWDPTKAIEALKLDTLQDSDPRATQAMKKIKELWNTAPPNRAIVGKAIRIPGFIVPLEYTGKRIKEFLLVPYFGACVHVPPPPANQIIAVTPAKPVKLDKGMDAVWVEGILEAASRRTDMGESGYRLRASKVEPYKPR